METIEIRAKQAEQLWLEGTRFEEADQFQKAYELYTEAHDLVIDCARLHQKAHVKLRRVNLKMGHYRELITDWALQVFAPLKVFEVVSYFAKSDGYYASLCRRKP